MSQTPRATVPSVPVNKGKDEEEQCPHCPDSTNGAHADEEPQRDGT